MHVFGNRSTISAFFMPLRSNGIILMFLWAAGAFIVPPCPIIRYAKGKAEKRMKYIYIYIFFLLRPLFALRTKCVAPESKSLKIVNCAHPVANHRVYTSPKATLMNHHR